MFRKNHPKSPVERAECIFTTRRRSSAAVDVDWNWTGPAELAAQLAGL